MRAASPAPASAPAQMMVLGVTVFVSMLGLGNVAPFLPIMARDLGASGVVLGLIFSSFSASRALVVPYVGAWSDRWGRKPFLIIGMAGTGALGVALIWAATPWEVVMNRVLQGAFAAMVLPVGMALVADLAPHGAEGRSFGSFNTYFLLGFGVGPLMGGALFDAFGLTANFLALAGLSAASLVLVAWAIREAPAGERRHETGGWRQQAHLLKDRGMLGVFLARAGSTMAMGCYITFLPLLSVEKGLSNFQVGVLLAANVLLMTGLQGPAGRLADRRSRLVLSVAGLAASALGKAFMPLSEGFWGLMAWNLIEGVGAGLALPPLTALVVDHGRRLDVGMGAAMGLFALALSVGVFIGPLLGGWLTDLGSTAWSFYFSGLVGLLGAGALIVLRPR